MMERHGVYRMFVGQFQLIAGNRLGKIVPELVASLNTHDMFPFSSFWTEKDIAERLKLKLLTAEGAREELARRQQVKNILIQTLDYPGLDPVSSQISENALKAALGYLAKSPAYALLVNLEDLWGETHPQNIPGTQTQRNWTHKARYSFEEFSQSRQVLNTFSHINAVRKGINLIR